MVRLFLPREEMLMVEYLDYTSPDIEYAFDVNTSPLFIKDSNNYINVLGISQLNSLDNSSLLDIFLSKGNVVEPHYHQNAAELVYCISGSAKVYMLNPFTKQLLQFAITPGQVTNVPQGWWHYEVADEDHTHLLAIFNAPTPQVILGSDLLSFTPASIMQQTYCIDEEQWKETIKPVKPSTYIGPYTDCESNNNHSTPNSNQSYYQRSLPNPYYMQAPFHPHYRY